MSNSSDITRFENLLRSTNRENIESLIEYIRKTDFYSAPASTRFHSCHAGGLLEHSLKVYECLMSKMNNPIWAEKLGDIDKSSLVIASLLHDLCKAEMYITEPRNRKVYSEYGKKCDSKGRFDWETYDAYTIDEKFPVGHGEKSVIIAMSFIKLKKPELYAIRWHMGFSEPKEQWNAMTAAIKSCPLVLALHGADIEATYLLEKEE